MKDIWRNYSRRFRLVYYVVPGAASGSIRKAIRCGMRNGTKIEPPPGFFHFTSARNPWDRLLSVYINAVAGVGKRPFSIGHILWDLSLNEDCSFADFVKKICDRKDQDSNIYYRSQSVFFTDDIELILKYERLNRDWRKLRRLRPKLPKALPKPPPPSYGDYRDYYSEELIDLVGIRYQTDIELLGYERPQLQ